ncbi:MAG: reverse transcriptase/maturase family protein [Dehalococcoidales bacterium]|nr:reverse transcriptase/maturase family protein [Dehalococcoidales bacterium]
MKRYGNLYEQIIDLGNIALAHHNAKKGKGHYSEVKMVESDKAYYLGQVRERLSEKTFHTAPYRKNIVFDSGKLREIYKLPYFPDRIVHHAIMNVLQPIWDKTFIYDCYSAVPGKGIHAGLARLHSFMKDKDNTLYCLKFDIHHYYPSVRHDTLMKIIKETIKCKDTLWLLEGIVRSAGGTTNIPIGNYLSQYFANIYMSGFDHWLKEDKGMKYYIRYSDDGVILHASKETLNSLMVEIREYLGTLSLELNPKTQIFPVDKRGVDFLGYRSFRDYTLLRKSSVKNLKAKIKLIERDYEHLSPIFVVSSVMSYLGWIKHCDGHNLLLKYVLRNDNLLRAMDRASESLDIRNPLGGLTHG